MSLGFPTATQPVTVAREGTAENKRKILAGFLLSFLSTPPPPPVLPTHGGGRHTILTCHLNSELCWEALPPASPPDAPLEAPFLLYFIYLRALGAGWYRGQRTTCRNQYSPFAVWVWGSNSSCQACRQTPLSHLMVPGNFLKQWEQRSRRKGGREGQEMRPHLALPTSLFPRHRRKEDKGWNDHLGSVVLPQRQSVIKIRPFLDSALPGCLPFLAGDLVGQSR